MTHTAGRYDLDGRRLCEEPGCDRPHKSNGRCAKCVQTWRNRQRGVKPRAVGRSSCTIEGCAKPLARNGLCGMHALRLERHGTVEPSFATAPSYESCIARIGPDRTCGRDHYAKGYCTAHYARLKRGAPVDVPLREQRNSGRRCSVDGCDAELAANGYCFRHLQAWRAHGDPLMRTRAAPGERVACAIDGCDRPSFGHGLCQNHRRSLARDGDPLAPHRRSMTVTHCEVVGCTGEVMAERMCKLHLRRFRQWGDPSIVAHRGYDVTAPARLYIMAHDGFGAVKVGVTSTELIDRVATHVRRGWRLLHVVEMPTGRDALLAEARVLALWCGLTGFVPAAAMPQGGTTETIAADRFDEASVLAAINQSP